MRVCVCVRVFLAILAWSWCNCFFQSCWCLVDPLSIYRTPKAEICTASIKCTGASPRPPSLCPLPRPRKRIFVPANFANCKSWQGTSMSIFGLTSGLNTSVLSSPRTKSKSKGHHETPVKSKEKGWKRPVFSKMRLVLVPLWPMIFLVTWKPRQSIVGSRKKWHQIFLETILFSPFFSLHLQPACSDTPEPTSGCASSAWLAATTWVHSRACC